MASYGQHVEHILRCELFRESGAESIFTTSILQISIHLRGRKRSLKLSCNVWWVYMSLSWNWYRKKFWLRSCCVRPHYIQQCASVSEPFVDSRLSDKKRVIQLPGLRPHDQGMFSWITTFTRRSGRKIASIIWPIFVPGYLTVSSELLYFSWYRSKRPHCKCMIWTISPRFSGRHSKCTWLAPGISGFSQVKEIMMRDEVQDLYWSSSARGN